MTTYAAPCGAKVKATDQDSGCRQRTMRNVFFFLTKMRQLFYSYNTSLRQMNAVY
jgi:hypothetical protein